MPVETQACFATSPTLTLERPSGKIRLRPAANDDPMQAISLITAILARFFYLCAKPGTCNGNGARALTRHPTKVAAWMHQCFRRSSRLWQSGALRLDRGIDATRTRCLLWRITSTTSRNCSSHARSEIAHLTAESRPGLFLASDSAPAFRRAMRG
jgi:hypothetical protein